MNEAVSYAMQNLVVLSDTKVEFKHDKKRLDAVATLDMRAADVSRIATTFLAHDKYSSKVLTEVTDYVGQKTSQLFRSVNVQSPHLANGKGYLPLVETSTHLSGAPEIQNRVNAYYTNVCALLFAADTQFKRHPLSGITKIVNDKALIGALYEIYSEGADPTTASDPYTNESSDSAVLLQSLEELRVQKTYTVRSLHPHTFSQRLSHWSSRGKDRLRPEVEYPLIEALQMTVVRDMAAWFEAARQKEREGVLA